MSSLEDAAAQFFTDNTEATLAELVEHLLKLQMRGELDEESQIWIESAQRRGVEHAVAVRLRHAAHVRVRGVSVRRFVAWMDEGEEHRWGNLQEIAADPVRRQGAIAHAWSVIAEACGMLREHRAVLVALGEAKSMVDPRIADMVANALKDEETPA